MTYSLYLELAYKHRKNQHKKATRSLIRRNIATNKLPLQTGLVGEIPVFPTTVFLSGQLLPTLQES